MSSVRFAIGAAQGLIAGCSIALTLGPPALAGLAGSESVAMIAALQAQGVSPSSVLGFDRRGVPLVCGTAQPGADGAGTAARALAPGTRGWQTVPSVIRNDGVETFRLEVDVNGPEAAVTLDSIFDAGIVTASAPPIALLDDGAGADRIAGDFVYSAGPFAWNPAVPMYDRFRNDPDSPQGLQVVAIGGVSILEPGGETTEFLVAPAVGLLHSDVPEVERTSLAPDVAVSPHLINVSTDFRATQNFLHGLDADKLPDVAKRIYSVLPDVFDFLMFLSTDKIEQIPRLSSANFTAGIHRSTRVNYDGTGQTPYDIAGSFGSAGRLLSVNALDAYDRGLYAGNATHELLHQWSAFVNFSFGVKGDAAHWSPYSNIASMVGGFRWVEQGDGSFVLDCDQGRNGGFHASPVDKYMMGLIDADEVPTMRAYDAGTASPGVRCNANPPKPVMPGDVIAEVTIADFQSQHGVRIPDPGTAQRHFRIGFVAESHGRALNETEFTFYDTLARYYATPVVRGAPDPFVGFNWVPIDRYFGEGTTWTSAVSTASSTTTTTTTTFTSTTNSATTTTSTSTTTTNSTSTSTSTILTSTTNGSGTTLPPAATCSDATADGVTTATDALQILRAAIGGGGCVACRCDINGDGTINATDALAALRIAVGIGSDSMNCPPCGAD